MLEKNNTISCKIKYIPGNCLHLPSMKSQELSKAEVGSLSVQNTAPTLYKVVENFQDRFYFVFPDFNFSAIYSLTQRLFANTVLHNYEKPV